MTVRPAGHRTARLSRRFGRRSVTSALAITAVLGLGVAGLGQASTAAADQDKGTASRSDPLPAGYFLGIDGIVHPAANIVIGGADGMLFLGQDFDTACADGASFKKGLKGLAKLITVIEKSGRKAMFTIAPNKSSAKPDEVADTLPHGPCDAVGLERQQRLLDSFHRGNYVPLRKKLSKTDYPYWLTDAHWSTVGASVMAEQVAGELSKKLKKRQRYVRTQRTRIGDLATYINQPTPETAPAKLPHNGVKTSPAPGSDAYDPTFQTLQPDNSWVSLPAGKTWRGHTLLLGDSFMYTALEPMRNLFNRGRYLWVGNNSVNTVLGAIRDSDTVVIEVVQRFVSTTALATPTFRRQVAQTLAAG